MARETIEREAAEQAIPLEHHFAHLLAHGLLHLLGFDHETNEEAETMESAETRVLARLGIPDPYRTEEEFVGPSA
jgi:probable rRNA maturation factor